MKKYFIFPQTIIFLILILMDNKIFPGREFEAENHNKVDIDWLRQRVWKSNSFFGFINIIQDLNNHWI